MAKLTDAEVVQLLNRKRSQDDPDDPAPRSALEALVREAATYPDRGQ
jgi:hypothetical protein